MVVLVMNTSVHTVFLFLGQTIAAVDPVEEASSMLIWQPKALEETESMVTSGEQCLVGEASTPAIQVPFGDYPLTTQERQEMEALITKYQDVFSSEAESLGKCDFVQHSIPTEGDPIRSVPYRLGPRKEQILEGELRRMLDKGVIRPSRSPWSSPVVLVQKKDGGGGSASITAESMR